MREVTAEKGTAVGSVEGGRKNGLMHWKEAKGKCGVLEYVFTPTSVSLPFPSARSSWDFLSGSVIISGRAACPDLLQDNWWWQGCPENKGTTARSPRWVPDE